MNLLHQYGWTQPQQKAINIENNLAPARVISITGFIHTIVTATGFLEAELSGRLLFENSNEDLPKVGDWILYTPLDSGGYIIEVLPRRNVLSRKAAGRKVERQVLAANIDFGIVVQAVDRDFNLMRLDRFITQITACGIEPVVVLNKCDLVDDVNVFVDEVKRLQRGAKVFVCSTVTKVGLEKMLSELLLPGKTSVLLGSSGVGKSSLLNALLSEQRQSIGPLSDLTHKGKHTTTSRDLFLLPNGSIIIDTPGMREFGVTAEESQAGAALFPKIEELSTKCKFSDCSHTNEIGCAVLEALQTGALDEIIYTSYVKLVKEQRRFQISAEEKKQQAKRFGKITKEAKNHRKRYKF